MESNLFSNELPCPFKKIVARLDEDAELNKAYNAFFEEHQRVNDKCITQNLVAYKSESKVLIEEIATKLATSAPTEEMALKAVISYCLSICHGIFCNYEGRFVKSQVDFTASVNTNITGLQNSAFVNFQDPEIGKSNFTYEYYECFCNETFKIYKNSTKVQEDSKSNMWCSSSRYYNSYIVVFNTSANNSFAFFDTQKT
jgi:hypothetical protein